MVDIIIAALVILFMVLMAVQGGLFYYLEMSNSYDNKPFLKINFGLLSFYDKDVKEKDRFIKRLRNILLRFAGYTLLLAIVFNVVIVIFKLK